MFGKSENDPATAGSDQLTSQAAVDPWKSINLVSPENACKTSAMTTHSCRSSPLVSTCGELVEDFVYECPYCGDTRIEVELDRNSKGLITQGYVACLPLIKFIGEPRKVTVKRVVCMDCGEVVPDALLPDSLLFGGRQWHALVLQFKNAPTGPATTFSPDSSDAKTATAREVAEAGKEGSESFGCPRCSCRIAAVHLHTYVRYSILYKPMERVKARLDESRIRNATCTQCGYEFLEGMLPSRIAVHANFKWTIDVCLGAVISHLLIRAWESQIADAVRSAYVQMIYHKYEATRRLIRRIIRILRVRSESLKTGPVVDDHTSWKHWNADQMCVRADSLAQKFLTHPHPVFDPGQCIEPSGCPYLWLDPHYLDEPLCFPWAGGSCQRKREVEQDRAVS